MNLRDFFLSPVVVTMADTPKIEKRLRAILDAGQRRETGRRIGRASVAVATASALTAFAALALLRPVAVRAQQPSAGSTSEQGSRTDEDRIAKQIACLNNLRLIGQTLAMYAQDYDEKLPPLKSNATLKNRLRPYIFSIYRHQPPVSARTEAVFGDLPSLGPAPLPDVTPIFTCPETGRPYLPIAALGEKSLDRLSSPAFTMVVRDAVPHLGLGTNGFWNVVYADGHVKRALEIPAIPPLRPIPPTLQRAMATRNRERAARQRIQEQIWRQKQQRQQQRQGANTIRPQTAHQVQRTAARANQAALVAQYAAEAAAARATLASTTQLQQERKVAGDEHLRSALNQQRTAARIRLTFAQTQLTNAKRQRDKWNKQGFSEAVRAYNSLRPFIYKVYKDSAKAPGGIAGRPPADLLTPDFMYLRADGARLNRATYLAERARETAASKKTQINRLFVRGREDGTAGEYGVFITRQVGSVTALTTLDTWVKSPAGWRLRRSEERAAPPPDEAQPLARPTAAVSRARAAQVNLREAQDVLVAAQRRLQTRVRSRQQQESDISRLNIQAAQAELESARARLEAAQAEVAVAASTSDAQNTLPVSSEKVTVGPGRMFGSRPTFNVAYRVGKPDDGKGHLLLVVLTDQRGTHKAGSFGYPPGGMSTGGVLYLGSTPTMGTPVIIHVYDNGRLISEVTR